MLGACVSALRLMRVFLCCRKFIELFREIPMAVLGLRSHLELLAWTEGQNATLDPLVCACRWRTVFWDAALP